MNTSIATRTARPSQFNLNAWDTIKKQANQIWAWHLEGKSWKQSVKVTCREFYEMLLDQNGELIIDPKQLLWVPNQRINNWFRELKTETDRLVEMGMYREALPKLRVMICIKRNDYQTLCQLALSLKQTGDQISSLLYLNKAIQLYPGYERAYTLRAAILSARDEDDKALRDLNTAIAINDKQASSFISRSILHRNRGDLDRALTDIQRAIKLDGNNDKVYTQLGLLFEETGQVLMAYKAYRKALRINPFDSESLYRRALIRIALRISLKAAGDDLLLARSLGHPLAEEAYLENFTELERLGIKSRH